MYCVHRLKSVTDRAVVEQELTIYRDRGTRVKHSEYVCGWGRRAREREREREIGDNERQEVTISVSD